MSATSNPTLAQALITFQKDAPRIALDSTNPHFKNRYASLAGIMEAIRTPLAECGLAIVQQPTVLESGVAALETTLLHESGESISDVMPLAVDKPGPQALGSALTYARRYSVLAILGLVAEEPDDVTDDDDDGTQAQAASEKAVASKAAAQKSIFGEEQQIDELAKKLLEGGHITEEQLESARQSGGEDLLGRLQRYAETKGVA